MIKFFRNIRQRLLAENRVSRYFIYAIGEIVLVVIGILIALQINNWNEQRKLLNEEHELLMDIQSNIVTTINDLKRDSIGNSRDLRLYAKIEHALENDLPYNASLDSAFGRLTYWFSPYVTSTAYRSLQTKGLDLIQNEELKAEIVKMYEVTSKTLTYDYEDTEWGLSTNVVVPFFSKHIRRLHQESLFLSRPNDFEKLKQNDEFKNILSMIIRQRKRGLQFFHEASVEMEQLTNMIDQELKKQ